MELKKLFLEACFHYNSDVKIHEGLWSEIEKKYSQKSRYYHNLEHLMNMFQELNEVRNQIKDFEIITFSVFYHDIIYKASSKENEEKSAELAVSRLAKLQLSEHNLQTIEQQILATKKHQFSESDDINFLTDADLSILGVERNIYQKYTENIRKEYSVYPDFLYKPGRKKALQHFLEFETIFKTKHFKEKYEDKARENLKWEIDNL